MRALLQRVTRASVDVDGEVVGAIEHGLLVLAGVKSGDTSEDATWIADKIVGLRLFPDAAGKMNRSVLEAGGAVLLVSQFTLHADTRKGRRPSFVAAAPPGEAVPLLDELKQRIEASEIRVASGRFGAHMKVDLLNDGPVTILLDSEDRPRGASGGDGDDSVVAAERLHQGRLRLLGPESPLARIPLVLGSASPRRRDLLRDLGLSFTVRLRTSRETDVPDARTTPESRSARRARLRMIQRPSCCHETRIVVGGRILGGHAPRKRHRDAQATVRRA
jgi:D-tyrosyl-tRNA(Tyr) deacylase